MKHRRNGSSADAFADSFEISRGDGNLGDEPVADDATVLRLTYAGARPAPATAARLHDLVSSNYGGTTVIDGIVVTALNAGIDPYSGQDVTGNGFTYVDSTGPVTVIRVVYDITLCNGNGIFVFDVNGNHISLARAPLLYHELSHAFRGATNSNLPNDEPPAETDENVMRTAMGYCLRDINNHGGGCGGGDNCSGPDPGTGGCFIVSATTGSPASTEVQSLRQLRDRVAAHSLLGALLIDAIYAEYWRFSPAIARQLRVAAPARRIVLWTVVRPLIGWYRLAGVLAFDVANSSAVRDAAAELSAACPRWLGRHAMAARLRRLREGQSLPAILEPLLSSFAPGLQQAARLPLVAWAVLDALEAAWENSDSTEQAVAAVGRWLGDAPIERLPSASQFAHQHAALLRLLDFDPAARARLAQRLSVATPPEPGDQS